MFRSLTLFSAAVAIACSPARAEDSRFNRPGIGFVFDADLRQIRPLSGTPGAALVIAGVQLDFTLDRALVSSARSFAVAATSDSDKLKVIRFAESEPVVTSIPDSVGTFDLGAFSRTGRAAVIYQSGCRCVQIISGLPDAPQVARTVKLNDESVLQALAVTDDAGKFAIATRLGDNAEVAVYSPDTRSVNLLSADALSFSPDGTSLALVDSSGKTVSVLQDGNLVQVATELNGISSPAALAYLDANRIVLADRESRVHLIAIDTGRVTSVDCPCKPSAVEPTSVENTFRISDIAAGALWIVQVTDESVRAMFIPVDRGDSRQSAEDAK
jgi:hypothetical protein